MRFRSQQPSHLRFWRPYPRDVADVICGEGVVDDLPLHAHQMLQVTLPASRYAVTDGRRTIVVRPGQIHVVVPLELYGARSLDGAACAMRVLLVGPSIVSALEERLARRLPATTQGATEFIVDDPELYGELWALIGSLRGPLVATTGAPRLLAYLGGLFGARAAQPTLASKSNAARQPDGVERVRTHLRARIAERISLDELASVAGLSKFYLLRAFRRAHGVTPHAYQMQLRLALAWRLIVDGQSLSSATYDAGFADQSHLTRCFSSAFGLTPARYVRELAIPADADQFAASASQARAAS